MKKIDFRNLIVALVSAVINRSIILMMNPFGIAYFASAYMYKPGRGLLALASILGMSSALPVNVLIKYVGVIMGIIIITKLLEIRKVVVSPVKMAVISGILVSVAGFAYSLGLNGLYRQDLLRTAVISSLEGITALVSVFIFNKAVGTILNRKGEKIISNEEQISLGIVFALCVFAFQGEMIARYSIMEAFIFFILLYMGYCYGAGAGAVAGACIGSVLAYQQNDIAVMGFMCVLGILAGVFRERGRILSGAVYLAGVGLIGYLGIPWLLQMTTVRGILAGSLLFLLLPDSFVRVAGRQRIKKPEMLTSDNIEKMTKDRLREFSSSFKKISQTFNESVQPRIDLTKEEVDEAFDELTSNVCSRCSRCEYCWEREYFDTYNAATNILDYFSKNGEMERSQVPISFKRRCINIEGFLNETSRVMEVAKLNLNWKNRLMESRLAVAGQLCEVAGIIDEFADELEEENIVIQSEADRLKQKLALSKINVKSLTIVEKLNHRKTIYMVAKTRRGRCVTSKEIGEIIKEVLGRNYTLAKGSRMVVSKEYNTFEFVEDIRFRTLHGVAKTIKAKESVSGDSYTFMPLDTGQLIMSLSDGMGAGEAANEDSEYIIEVLEQMMESGFSKHSAIRLINSVMFLKSDKQAFSTIDMGILDLYSGICEFIKIGASTTFIKNKNRAEAIRSTTLPVGAFTQVEYDGISRELSDGDMIIMVSDGIINSLEGEDNDENLREYIANLNINNPQELANMVLEYSMQNSNFDINDDMTVLTCGFYKTSN